MVHTIHRGGTFVRAAAFQLPNHNDNGCGLPVGMLTRAPRMHTNNQLSALRVLLVEDEPLVSMGIGDQLRAAGATIVGPCATAHRAIDTLQSHDVDVAVVDFVLADNNSEPVQLALEEKGVPFVVLTAYPPVLVRRYEGQEILQKPAAAQLLCSTVQRLARSRHRA